MIKTLLLGLLGLAWGGFWGLVRDQDGPYWKGKPADASGNKWKEVGVALFGLPAALVVYWSWPPEPWWGGLVAAIFILVMLGGPWSFGHPKGYAQLDSERSKFLLAGLSALPGIGPGVVLVALGWWWLAPWPATPRPAIRPQRPGPPLRPGGGGRPCEPGAGDAGPGAAIGTGPFMTGHGDSIRVKSPPF